MTGQVVDVPDAPEVEPIYQACATRDLPVVIHAGREPKSPGRIRRRRR